MDSLIIFPGKVHGLGVESFSASKLYAQLTGRPCQLHDTAATLRVECSDVVVCSTRRLTASLMHQLFVEGAGAGVPGVISAPTSESLEDLCRNYAYKVSQPAAENNRRAFIFPGANFPFVQRGNDTFAGGTQPDEIVLPLLSSDPAILSIMGGHSDGIDFSVSARQFACAFLNSIPPAGRLLPRCQAEGRCTRFPSLPSMEEAAAAGWLVPLSLLRAQIALVLECNVLRLQDGVIDPAYGVAAALLAQAGLNALITTWRREVIVQDGRHMNSLINDLSAGMPVGQAVRVFNGSTVARHLGINLCVIGDPCYGLKPDAGFASLPVCHIDLSKTSASALPDVPEIHDAALLREAVVQAMQNSGTYDSAKGNALVASLSAMARQEHSNSAGKNDVRVSHDLLDFLSEAPWLDKLFASVATIEEMSEDGICASCLAPARTFLSRMRANPGRMRRVIRCACCSDSSSLPLGWEVNLDLSRINEGRLSVSGIPSGATVLLCLMSLAGPGNQAYPLVVQPENICTFQLPDDLSSNPLYCQVLIASGLELGSVGFRFRKSSQGMITTSRPAFNGVMEAVSPADATLCSVAGDGRARGEIGR
jgi:hypothetical protein